MNTLTFTEYLNQQTERHDPIGDIARDAASDIKWPETASNVSEYHEHLTNAGACDGAHAALDRAWQEYESEGASDTPVPVLPAVASESGRSLLVWCVWCGKHHWHGRHADEAPGMSNGHHVAHCDIEDSPYTETGYDLFEVDSLPEPAHVIRPRYGRNGSFKSGYLAKQRAALRARK